MERIWRLRKRGGMVNRSKGCGRERGKVGGRKLVRVREEERERGRAGREDKGRKEGGGLQGSMIVIILFSNNLRISVTYWRWGTKPPTMIPQFMVPPTPTPAIQNCYRLLDTDASALCRYTKPSSPTLTSTPRFMVLPPTTTPTIQVNCYHFLHSSLFPSSTSSLLRSSLPPLPPLLCLYFI